MKSEKLNFCKQLRYPINKKKTLVTFGCALWIGIDQDLCPLVLYIQNVLLISVIWKKNLFTHDFIILKSRSVVKIVIFVDSIFYILIETFKQRKLNVLLLFCSGIICVFCKFFNLKKESHFFIINKKICIKWEDVLVWSDLKATRVSLFKKISLHEKKFCHALLKFHRFHFSYTNTIYVIFYYPIQILLYKVN